MWMSEEAGWSCLGQREVGRRIDEELSRLPVHDDELLWAATLPRTEQQQQLKKDRNLR